MKVNFLIIAVLFSLNVYSKNNSSQGDYFPGLEGELINVMRPCDPGCYVEIKVVNDIISSPTTGISSDDLYKLENDKNNSITLMYSANEGPYLIHHNSKRKILLTGPMNIHPIDYALSECTSTPEGGTTVGINDCLFEAESAWDTELNRIYSMLGGDQNKDLKNVQLAWIKFRDAQFKWFDEVFGNKDGSKWSYGIRKRRVNLVKSQVKRLQSFYKGY